MIRMVSFSSSEHICLNLDYFTQNFTSYYISKRLMCQCAQCFQILFWYSDLFQNLFIRQIKMLQTIILNEVTVDDYTQTGSLLRMISPHREQLFGPPEVVKNISLSKKKVCQPDHLCWVQPPDPSKVVKNISLSIKRYFSLIIPAGFSLQTP